MQPIKLGLQEYDAKRSKILVSFGLHSEATLLPDWPGFTIVLFERRAALKTTMPELGVNS